MIALLALVVIVGVGCMPATITTNAPTPRGSRRNHRAEFRSKRDGDASYADAG